MLELDIRDNKIVITLRPETILFDLPYDTGTNVKHKTESIIKHNKLLAEHIIQNEIRQLLSKYNHGNNIHELRKQ